MVNGLDLQLIQSASNITTGFNNAKAAKNDEVVYARKGEPMYQKEMDADEDGIITFQEFNDYCDENDISYGQRSEMLQNRLHFQLHTDRARVSEEIRQIKSDSDAVYAKEGDDEYSEEIDEDGDGKITYDEYLRYCEEQEKLQDEPQPEKAKLGTNDDEQIIIKNEGKAINKYAQTEAKEPESKVEEEA